MFKLSSEDRPPITVKAVLNNMISQRRHKLTPTIFNVDKAVSGKPTKFLVLTDEDIQSFPRLSW